MCGRLVYLLCGLQNRSNSPNQINRHYYDNINAIFSLSVPQYHKLVYAEDILLLNDYNSDYNMESNGPKILCIALPTGEKQIMNGIKCELNQWMKSALSQSI